MREVVFRQGVQQSLAGWYQYVRDDKGRIRQLDYHRASDQAAQTPSPDDLLWSSVEIGYDRDLRMPHTASLRYSAGMLAHVRFDYDSDGRLTGGVREGAWSASFSVVGGHCSEVPERIFVLLLSTDGGPWRPYTRGRRSAGPNDAR